MTKEKISIIGAGRLGSNLAMQFANLDYPIVSIINRTQRKALELARTVHCSIASSNLTALSSDTQILFIATPDRSIATIAQKLAHLPMDFSGKFVYHLSGSLDASILAPLQHRAALVAVVHPIQSFTPVETGLTTFRNIYFGLDGGTQAIEKARQLIQELGARALVIPSELKPLYHAGCVVASNYLVALFKIVSIIFKELNVTEKQAINLVSPLIQTTFENVQQQGISKALTGPIARGDVTTIQSHLRQLSQNVSELVPIYCSLGKILVNMRLYDGKIDSGTVNQIMDIFQTFPNTTDNC